jgi:hypothetical protein
VATGGINYYGLAGAQRSKYRAIIIYTVDGTSMNIE